MMKTGNLDISSDGEYLYWKIGKSLSKKRRGSADRQPLLDTLGSITELDIETLGRIEEKLRLTFVPEKEEVGNVCMANSPEVRDEYKNSFTAKDLLDYLYAVLHSPHYLMKYKDLSKIDVVEVPHPTDQNRFWKLAGLGAQLRRLHLSGSHSVKKYSGETTEIMRKIAEIEMEESL